MRSQNIQIPWNSLKEDHRNLDVELNMSGLAQTLHSLLKPLYINAMSCHACHVMSCHVTLCYATLRYIKSCYVMLRIIKSCYVMLCHVKLSCVMLITQRQQTRWPKIRFLKKNNNKECTSKDCKLSGVLEAFCCLSWNWKQGPDLQVALWQSFNNLQGLPWFQDIESWRSRHKRSNSFRCHHRKLTFHHEFMGVGESDIFKGG